ncbi:FACT complex subunit SPT16-like [Xenia sp. Carnegie-2017]|uniref:FACT complex subunit SPT16-like n=1 Tax=Xenia sp. Carnegie-2017 TaxID=2897299 RepID=UPI001F03E0AC|nr:FACT complex subunit SPT16-like [Xenia sp. Carnegie-2017]
MSSSKISLDKEAFFRRAKRIYAAWKASSSENGTSLKEVDSIVVAVGNDEDILYSKSTALHQWLLGYELSDTLMVFADNSINILASKKKIDFLKPLVEARKKHEGFPEINLNLRDKSDKDKTNIEKLIKIMKESKKGKNIGVFVKDNFHGDFMDSWNEALKKLPFEKVDISSNIAYTMAAKEDGELNNVKKASLVTSDIFSKFFKNHIMEIVDQEKRVKHTKIADNVEAALESKKYLVSGMDHELTEMCFNPIIQSGENFSLKFSAQSNDDRLDFGVIICIFGVRYKYYCSSIIRTMLVQPSEEQQGNYNILLSTLDVVIDKLKDGVKLCDVYNTALEHVKEKKPDLVSKFVKSIGFVMGIEFRESSLIINAKSSHKAQKGMVFCISVGFSGLSNKEENSTKEKQYALFIGDTVVINDKGPATLLTLAKKKINNIGIFLKDEDEQDDSDNVDEEALLRNTDGKSKLLENRTRTEMNAEDKRKAHQQELREQLHEEAKRRLLETKGKTPEKKIRASNIAYKHSSLVPRDKDVRELKVFLDKKYEAVILPVFGIATPFHISTVKNISTSVEGDYTYLRINFFSPGSALAKPDVNNFAEPDATFLKEVTYRSSMQKSMGQSVASAANLNNAFRFIKEVQKKFKTREAEEKEKEGIVKQDALVVNNSKNNPKLKDLYIRPTLGTRRIPGTLEAHMNGFRFQCVNGERVDILYGNIKHAFFQPCDHEMIILIHFHLKNAIIIGKKKYRDIQYYTEVGEITTDLGKNQHMHDRDDLQAEQAERELRQRLKAAFKHFIDRVEGITHGQVEFDVPFRELGFIGVPFRSTVLLQPTTHCLVMLTEQPVFVITLDEVELVHFERVQFHLKNFDMVFIFKEYTRKVEHVNSIPMTSLDSVKEWLNSCDIKYTEGVQSLNWNRIMKTITNDPQDFIENGGWSFLEPDSSDEEQEEEDEEESEYAPSDSDVAVSESEESELSGETSESEEDSEFEEELGSDEESGKDWSELEEEATKADKERGRVEDDTSASRKRKKSSGNAATPNKKKDVNKSRTPKVKRTHKTRTTYDAVKKDKTN